MKIYLAGASSKERNKALYDFRANRLFSYYTLIDKNSGYGEIDRLNDLIEWIKNENISCGRIIQSS